MMLGVVRKQPGDTLDYDIDFERWLVDGDALSHATATVDDETLVIVGAPEVIPPLVKVWLSGGVSGQSYKVTVTTHTTGGRVKEEDFTMRVIDC